jgi:transcriptional regulator with XRE-family HTH domain
LARVQHELALAVEAEIRERGITQAEFASETGVSPGTFGKRLRGTDPLHGEDLFAWVLHLGRVGLWPALANIDDLLP